jgi:hypothetical protein
MLRVKEDTVLGVVSEILSWKGPSRAEGRAAMRYVVIMVGTIYATFAGTRVPRDGRTARVVLKRGLALVEKLRVRKVKTGSCAVLRMKEGRESLQQEEELS